MNAAAPGSTSRAPPRPFTQIRLDETAAEVIPPTWITIPTNNQTPVRGPLRALWRHQMTSHEGFFELRSQRALEAIYVAVRYYRYR